MQILDTYYGAHYCPNSGFADLPLPSLPKCIKRGFLSSLQSFLMASALVPVLPDKIRMFVGQRIEDLEMCKAPAQLQDEEQIRKNKITNSKNLRELFRNAYKDKSMIAGMTAESLSFNAILIGIGAMLFPFGLTLILPCSILVGLVTFTQIAGNESLNAIRTHQHNKSNASSSLSTLINSPENREEAFKGSYKTALLSAVTASATFAAGIYAEHLLTNSSTQKILQPIWQKLTELEVDLSLRTTSAILDGAASSFEIKSSGGSVASPEGVVETVAAMLPSLII